MSYIAALKNVNIKTNFDRSQISQHNFVSKTRKLKSFDDITITDFKFRPVIAQSQRHTIDTRIMVPKLMHNV